MIAFRDQFEALYHQHQTEVYRYLRSMGLSSPDAQEIVQEAFLRLFQTLQSASPPLNPRAWVYRVAHNLGVDERDRRFIPDELPDPDRLPLLVDQTPELLLISKENARRLVEAWLTLSKQQRACLSLRAEGLRYREIAEVLSISTPPQANSSNAP